MLIQKLIKLVAHLYDRANYNLHYRSLKFLLFLKTTINNIEYGVIVKKVHNIISFNQSAWMKPYILGNNDVRKMLNMILFFLINE